MKKIHTLLICAAFAAGSVVAGLIDQQQPAANQTASADHADAVNQVAAETP